MRKLGRFEIHEELGRGAMGIVFLAFDPQLERKVVLKTLRREVIPEWDLKEYEERFRREAEAAGKLSHPGIVGVHTVVEDEEGGVFLAMEFVAGTNLQALLAAGARLPHDQVADLMADVAEALHYAHGHKIVHRDIKPANLFLGEGNRIKIGDFGIAKVEGSTLTATGQALGTPNYMSPEQIMGDPIDGRSDLFSLGVVAYQLLTMKSPFAAKDFNGVANRIISEMPPPPHAVVSDVPEAQSRAVMKALAKKPQDRYTTGDEMAQALRRKSAEPAPAPTSAPPPPPPRLTPPDAESTVAAPIPIVRTPAPPTMRLYATPPMTAPPVTTPLPQPAGSRGGLPPVVIGALAGFGAVALLILLILAGLRFLRPAPMERDDFARTSITLLGERRYDEVERLASERLARDPADAEAILYLDLARKGRDATQAVPPPPPPKPATLAVSLVSSHSGSVSVMADDLPVLEKTFAARQTYAFGRPVPGTYRPAVGKWETIVSAGPHRITVVAALKGRQEPLETTLDVDLAELATATLDLRIDGSQIEAAIVP